MSHKTMIGGTRYDIQSGRTTVGGTVYPVQNGRVMTDGTLWNIPFGAPVLRLGQDNPCGATVKLEDVGQYQLTVSDVPNGETAAGWLELTKNGVLYRLQPGDEVDFSCRISQSGGSCGVTFFTDQTDWENSALAEFTKLNNTMLSGTYAVTEPCYVRAWIRLTGNGTPFQSIKLALLSLQVNGESVPVEL